MGHYIRCRWAGKGRQGVQTPSIRRGGGEKSLEADFRHLVIIRPRSVSGPANIVRIQQNMSVYNPFGTVILPVFCYFFNLHFANLVGLI